MDLKAGLWQQQTLKLAMTQELSQAIALLQYSVSELTSFLEEKAAENPLLQVDFENVRTMDPRMDRSKMVRKKVEKDRANWIEQLGEKKASLSDHLLSQINLHTVTSRKKKILDEMIERIDENGYFRSDINEISRALNVSAGEAEECLHILQGLEPAGIAARSLQECLVLQMERDASFEGLAKTIISDHFLLFAEKKWKELSKILAINMRDIQQVFDRIQTLDPRPGSSFQHDKAVYITPDLVVSWDGTAFAVSVYEESLPRISFNQPYFQKLSANKDNEVQRFLTEKQQDYQWIVKSLEQRNETMKRVALKIVEKQAGFFKKGPENLKPMTMKEISEELGIHESTVSRTVREKYVQTPFGTFELRSFFTSTIQTTTSETASSTQVKSEIKQLVDAEDKQKPLSDQEMVELLKDKGMVVSRRTIAKYRDQLGIPSSSKRKRYD